MQPVFWTKDGLVCSPRVAPELAGPALESCPFEITSSQRIPGWPSPEARFLAGWYVRALEHAPGPIPSRELIQAPGDGFGPGGHATTAMCLAGLTRMPAGPALDVGCGSGLLSQAWVHMTGYRVVACDPNHAAIDQAARSLAAAGLEDRVLLQQALIQTLEIADLPHRVIFANLPAPGHRALIDRLSAAPSGVVASGIHGEHAREIVAGYRRLGMRVISAQRRGRWCCWGLVRE